jgi:type VI secretion system protein ImpA
MNNFDSLLTPVAEENPCGQDMSFSPEFDQIQEARRFDDPTINQGEWVTDIKEADWRLVSEKCSELLTNRTKDIRLAMWLAEAQAMTHSFEGLAQGFGLVHALIQRYWGEDGGGIYPVAEDGDQEQRIGNLGWLLTRTMQLVKQLPITDSARGDRFTVIDHEAARMLAQAISKTPHEAEQLSEGKVTTAQFEAAHRATKKEFYVKLVADVRASAAGLKLVESIVDEKLGSDGPSFTPAKDALASVHNLVERLAQQAGALDAADSQEGGAAQGTSGLTVGTVHAGPIQTRAQALALMRQVSDFLRRTEPHSPAAYLAEQAAKWGDMPLHIWLRSVMKDQGALAHIEELLGIKSADVGDDSSSS